MIKYNVLKNNQKTGSLDRSYMNQKITDIVRKLNQNKIFKYISSVKLAVPLMLLVSAVVAYGTVLESQYNSEYSSLMIYKTVWFGGLIIVLWLNIFCATISRIPFKKHHIGFVITHIGLLTLLAGGYVTNQYGVDGQLSVTEGQSSSSVVLPNLMIGYQAESAPAPQVVKFKKMISEKKQTDLDFLNDEVGYLFQVVRYVPFGQLDKTFKQSQNGSDDVALSFILKSNFFNVSEWLHTKNNAEMQLGPATLKIVKVESLDEKDLNINPKIKKQIAPKKPARVVNSVAAESGDVVEILDFKSGQKISEISVQKLLKQPLMYKGVQIKIAKQYRAAVVAANKLEESLDPNQSNPALELTVEKSGQKLREILYAKFSQFSLNKQGAFGLKFIFKSSGIAPSEQPIGTAGSNPHGGSGAGIPQTMQQAPESSAKNDTPSAADMKGQAPSMDSMGSRIVEFKVVASDKTKARVTLYKNNERVLSQIVNVGESLQTPWMGMTIFLGTIQVGSEEQIEVTPVNPEKRTQLPPSAVQIKVGVDQIFWLSEGEQKSVQILNKNYTIYFGREIIELPFNVNLQKFTKVDYPGTTTAMSFESLAQFGQGPILKVSMNEPHKQDGYTIYQASYVMNPGQPAVSVFSVNQDPGRFWKYLGSLILACGIIILTYMRSNAYKNKTKEKSV